jgi:hypothetical protein
LRTPDRLLFVTVGTQWLVTALVGIIATRTASVFGDPVTARATVDAAHEVATGGLPATGAPAYPLLLAPLALVTTNVSTVASIVTTLNVLILAPLASYCLLEVGRRVAGRIYAIAAALVWLLAPVVIVPMFASKYHDTYVDYVLPALYGLTLQPLYPAMVLSLAAAVLCLRAAAGADRAALGAGLAAAAAIACVPVSAGVAVGVVLALMVARRRRATLEALAGIAAGLVPTLLWRDRALSDHTFTLGGPTWAHFQATMAQVREVFWSNRLLQWVPIAGAIGMFRLGSVAATLVAAWVASAGVLVLATQSTFDHGEVLHAWAPAWPAYALLLAATPALVPTLLRRLGPRAEGETDATRVSTAVVAALLVLVLVGGTIAVGLVWL